MKQFIPIALIVAGCSGATAQSPVLPPLEHIAVGHDTTIARMRASTVVLVRSDDDGIGRVGCSGVWLTPNVILTAAHCVDEDAGYALYEDVGEHGGMDDAIVPRKLTFVKQDAVNDLALYFADVPPPPHPTASLGLAPIVSGQHVNIVGHSAGLAFSYSPAWVSSIRMMEGPEPIDTEVIQVFGGAWGGNSGGGLWDDDGLLIGICSYRLTTPPIHFFISRDVIVAFLTAEW